jgi:ATP-dependent protease Clp ATPase subunit
MGGSGQPRKKATARDINLEDAVTLQEYTESLEKMLQSTNPRLIRNHLDNYVIGQDEAKQSLSCAVYNHYSRVLYNLLKKKEAMSEFPSAVSKSLDKSNILILGPSK